MRRLDAGGGLRCRSLHRFTRRPIVFSAAAWRFAAILGCYERQIGGLSRIAAPGSILGARVVVLWFSAGLDAFAPSVCARAFASLAAIAATAPTTSTPSATTSFATLTAFAAVRAINARRFVGARSLRALFGGMAFVYWLSLTGSACDGSGSRFRIPSRM